MKPEFVTEEEGHKGVTQLGNRFRASINVDGKQIQKYFDTFGKAFVWWFNKDLERRPVEDFAVKTKKRSDAKTKDLPVGFVDATSRKSARNGGEYVYTSIEFHFKEKGKEKRISVAYGSKLSRTEAINKIKTRIRDEVLGKENK